MCIEGIPRVDRFRERRLLATLPCGSQPARLKMRRAYASPGSLLKAYAPEDLCGLNAPRASFPTYAIAMPWREAFNTTAM
jgi:hypothetical protein